MRDAHPIRCIRYRENIMEYNLTIFVDCIVYMTLNQRADEKSESEVYASGQKYLCTVVSFFIISFAGFASTKMHRYLSQNYFDDDWGEKQTEDNCGLF